MTKITAGELCSIEKENEKRAGDKDAEVTCWGRLIMQWRCRFLLRDIFVLFTSFQCMYALFIRKPACIIHLLAAKPTCLTVWIRIIMVALWNRADHYIFMLLFVLLSSFFMVALCNRADHYIFILFLFFFLLSSFFPRLISAVGDWMSTILPHMVWP